MSKFEDMMSNGGRKPVGKTVEFYADCQTCFEEVSEVEYFPNEKAMVYTCDQGHKNIMEGIDLPL